MSRATDLAEAEALAAEAEAPEPDEEEAGAEEEATPEPEPETEPEPASDRKMEEIGRKLDAEGARHAKRVAEIMGADYSDLSACPLCITPGFVLAEPPPYFDPDQRVAVLGAMGEDGAPDYKVSPNTEKCPECDGWAKVLTGSQDPNFITKGCDRCGAQGWVQKIALVPRYAPPAQEAYPGAGVQFTPPPMGSVDAWGRPAGHPQWGLEPASVGIA